MVSCECYIKNGGKGTVNTPYKEHVWNCIINIDNEYNIYWFTALYFVRKIERWYTNKRAKKIIL